jgi:hypothetical protein
LHLYHEGHVARIAYAKELVEDEEAGPMIKSDANKPTIKVGDALFSSSLDPQVFLFTTRISPLLSESLLSA